MNANADERVNRLIRQAHESAKTVVSVPVEEREQSSLDKNTVEFLKAKITAYEEVLERIRDEETPSPSQLAHNVLFLKKLGDKPWVGFK